MWYPIWLAWACAGVPDSRLLDCPAEGIGTSYAAQFASNYDLVVIHVGPTNLINDINVAKLIKNRNCECKIVFVGPIAYEQIDEILQSSAIDYVTTGEYDHTIRELAHGIPPTKVRGLSFRENASICHNPPRPLIEDLDTLPFVSPVYRKYLNIETYYLPFLRHPYVSIFTARGCPFLCTFCLWPQTFTGREYRVRSPENVGTEIAYIKQEMPEIREIMFDDDTFTVSEQRILELCKVFKPMNFTWSCNARPDVSGEVLKKMYDSGCRLLVVGYESGSDKILKSIKKGITVERAKRFTDECHDIGLMLHGTFVLGLPGETRESIRLTIDYAKSLDLDCFQFSIAAPYPGTELYDDLRERGAINEARGYVDSAGYQSCKLSLPNLSEDDILEEIENAHLEIIKSPRFLLRQIRRCLGSWPETRRIITNAWRYQRYLIGRP